MLITVATSVPPLQLAARVQLGGEHRQDLVAVDDVAVLVDEDGAVGVAVERDADVRAARADGRLQRSRVERAAVAVDVLAVGLDAERRRRARRAPPAPRAPTR